MKASRVIMVKNRLERLTHEREEDTTMIKILLVEDDLGLSNSACLRKANSMSLSCFLCYFDCHSSCFYFLNSSYWTF